jgi:uncharacterized Fe-S cluster protein YjdI
MEEVTKHYTNGEVTIVWKPAMCIHSRICWGKANSLPSVFNPKERPWIKADGASTERIIEQIKQCPSGALSFFVNEQEVLTAESEVLTETIVETLENGPLLIYGNISIKDKTGHITQKTNVNAFCRCGSSANKPYCDGSHARVKFVG